MEQQTLEHGIHEEVQTNPEEISLQYNVLSRNNNDHSLNLPKLEKRDTFQIIEMFNHSRTFNLNANSPRRPATAFEYFCNK